MRKSFFLAVLFLIPIFIFGSNIQFQSPTFDAPQFRIIYSVEVNKDGLQIDELRINDQKWDDYFIFLDGQNIDLRKPLVRGEYQVQVDYAWSNGKEYQVKIMAHSEDNPKISILKDIKGKAPEKGGIPSGKEGFYRIFRVEEQIGIARQQELVSFTFTARKEDLKDQKFFIFENGHSVEYQILDIKETLPPEKAAVDHPATLTIKIVAPLDIPSSSKKMLLLLFGDPAFSETPGLEITGEDLGKTIKNDQLALELHPVNGQINIIKNLNANIRLYNEAGVIHWNPGVFIPGIAWDHSFNWNPPPSFEEYSGKFLYINTRGGPLQKIKDVDLEVKYTIQKNKPFFLSETRLVVNKDLGVKAIRNDEMVLYNELFDTLIYKDRKDKIVKKPLQEKQGYPDGFVHAAPDNVDWVGLINSEKKYGFFCLRIEYVNANLGITGNWLNKPGTYFYAPSNGKYVYWVRPLLYTWADYATRNFLTYVPKGSQFYEKNAYILIKLEKGYEKKLNTLLLILKNPARIF